LRYVIREEFERNESPKLGVLGFVDDTHTTAPDLAEDAVMGDGLPNGLRRRVHLGGNVTGGLG
jgi:hypothetical protein